MEPLPSDVSMVTLERNETGSLGFQIASSGGFAYIKQITAEPALSCPNMQVGDKIVLVCFKFIYGSHKFFSLIRQTIKIVGRECYR